MGEIRMPLFGYRAPKRVTVDPSCRGLAAAYDPAVQSRALDLLGLSTAARNPAGRAEWGTMVSEPRFGRRFWLGHPFSEYRTNEISFDRIMRERPSQLENILSGYRPDSVLLHTHPNPRDPGEVSQYDRKLGIPVIAVDTKGRMTCAF
jgi:hypothetical protein